MEQTPKKLTAFATGTRVEEQNYPYGFRLRCTRFHWVEFKPKHGFRHVTQTTNPKAGDKLNKPKAGTYYGIMLIARNEENGHAETICASFDHEDQVIEILREHADKFTETELLYILRELKVYAIVGLKASVVYCGSNPDKATEAVKPYLQVLNRAIDGTERNYSKILEAYNKSEEELNALKVPNFNPFSSKNYSMSTGQLVQQGVEVPSDHQLRAQFLELNPQGDINGEEFQKFKAEKVREAQEINKNTGIY